MKSARFACLFAILISMLVLAQSSRDQVANQPSARTNAQQRHPALPPNLSQVHGLRALKETATPRESSSSGLSFAPAVPYGSGGYETDSVAVADVNGDGKPDLLVANECASYSHCENLP